GNWLVDSPRYLKHLVEAFEHKGGIAYIFLTHKDDVADAEKYAARFGAIRLRHRADLEAAPDSEWIIEGCDSEQGMPQFLVFPLAVRCGSPICRLSWSTWPTASPASPALLAPSSSKTTWGSPRHFSRRWDFGPVFLGHSRCPSDILSISCGAGKAGWWASELG